MPKKLDLTGQRYGRLVVINAAPNKNGRTMWNCKCDCGNTCVAPTASLRDGRKQSCGCLHSEMVAKRNTESAKDLTG